MITVFTIIFALAGLVGVLSLITWAGWHAWDNGLRNMVMASAVIAVCSNIIILIQPSVTMVVYTLALIANSCISYEFLRYTLGKIGDDGSKLLKVSAYTLLLPGSFWWLGIHIVDYVKTQIDKQVLKNADSGKVDISDAKVKDATVSDTPTSNNDESLLPDAKVDDVKSESTAK